MSDTPVTNYDYFIIMTIMIQCEHERKTENCSRYIAINIFTIHFPFSCHDLTQAFGFHSLQCLQFLASRPFKISRSALT